jgi:hypothetical protein
MRESLCLFILPAIFFADAGIACADDLITGMHPRNWTAPSLDDAFTILPCRAFRKNADGSWTLTGTLTDDNGETFTDKTVANNDQAKDLDSRCGNPQ